MFQWDTRSVQRAELASGSRDGGCRAGQGSPPPDQAGGRRGWDMAHAVSRGPGAGGQSELTMPSPPLGLPPPWLLHPCRDLRSTTLLPDWPRRLPFPC